MAAHNWGSPCERSELPPCTFVEVRGWGPTHGGQAHSTTSQVIDARFSDQRHPFFYCTSITLTSK
jgi:hypothetical protein